MTLIMNKNLIDDDLEINRSSSLNSMISRMAQSIKNLMSNVFENKDAEMEIMLNRIGGRASFTSRSLKRNSAFIYYSQLKDAK